MFKCALEKFVKLPTYPFPNSTLTFAFHLGQNVELEEAYVGSFAETWIDPKYKVVVYCANPIKVL